MLSNIKQQWHQLSTKDQRAIQILALVMVPILVIYLVILPILNAKAESESNLASKAELHQWLLDVGAEAKVRGRSATSINNAANSDSGDMSSKVIGLAKQYQIELQKFEIENEGGLRIWFDQVRFDHFFGFMQALKSDFGIDPSTLIIDREDDGVVSVRGTLRL